MLGTPQVLGSNLTRAVFFSNEKHSVSNKILGKFFLCFLICCRLSCHISKLFFFCAIFYAVFSVWFTPINCNFTYFDFVFPSWFFLFR